MLCTNDKSKLIKSGFRIMYDAGNLFTTVTHEDEFGYIAHETVCRSTECDGKYEMKVAGFFMHTMPFLYLDQEMLDDVTYAVKQLAEKVMIRDNVLRLLDQQVLLASNDIKVLDPEFTTNLKLDSR
jgi:hypothetical protein